MKIRLYYSLIVPIATYASETWTILAEDERRLLSFEMKCLRTILGVSLRNRYRNEAIRRMLNIDKTIIDIIRKKRIKWFGHIIRQPNTSYVKKVYKEEFNGKRPKGRPPKRWSDQIRLDADVPLLTAERASKDRKNWRKTIARNVARLSGVCR